MSMFQRKRFFGNTSNNGSGSGNGSGGNTPNNSPPNSSRHLDHAIMTSTTTNTSNNNGKLGKDSCHDDPSCMIPVGSGDLSDHSDNNNAGGGLHRSVSSSRRRGNVRRERTPTNLFGGTMDHSWCAGQGSRRRTNSSANNSGSSERRSSFAHLEDGGVSSSLTRHHSHTASAVTTAVGSMSPAHTTPLRSLSGARQRCSAMAASAASVLTNSPASVRAIKSPSQPRRNLSGDFMSDNSHGSHSNAYPRDASMSGSHNHHHHHHQSSQMPYGMLNPGPSGRHGPFRGHYKKGDSPYYYSSSPSILPILNSKQVVALFGFFTLAILGLAVYQHDAMLQDALHLKEQQVDHHLFHAKELEKRIQSLKSHSLDLEEKLEEYERQQTALERSGGNLDLETQRRLFTLEHFNLKMQQDVQTMCKRLLREKYVSLCWSIVY